MRRNYLKQASKRFLLGTRCACPCDAVESGKRTLEQWAAILAEERDLELQYLEAHRSAKHRRDTRVIRASSGHDHAAV